MTPSSFLRIPLSTILLATVCAFGQETRPRPILVALDSFEVLSVADSDVATSVSRRIAGQLAVDPTFALVSVEDSPEYTIGGSVFADGKSEYVMLTISSTELDEVVWVNVNYDPNASVVWMAKEAYKALSDVAAPGNSVNSCRIVCPVDAPAYAGLRGATECRKGWTPKCQCQTKAEPIAHCETTRAVASAESVTTHKHTK